VSAARRAVAASTQWSAVGAVLTADELRALGGLLASLASIGDDAPESRAMMSALRKLLDMPTGALTCCYHERANVVRLLNEQLLDEAPTNKDPNPAAMLRDAGYRAGWNDRARSLLKELLK